VFPSEVGTPLDAGNFLRRTHYPLLLERRSPRVRFHDLRHTAATLMLEQGTHPKVVAERLGHATVNVTLNVYSHVTATMQREAAATMDRLLSGGA
jgi:integrase